VTVAENVAGYTSASCSGARVRTRDGTIDTMRGVAILMVIGIHSLPKIEASALVTAADAVLRPCVPVFLFASGYLTAQTGTIPLTKRIVRTLVPYTIAFVAAYAFMAFTNPQMDQRLVVTAARYVFAYVFVYYYVFVYVGCTLLLWLVFAATGRGEPTRQPRLLVLLTLSIVIGLFVGAYLDPLLAHFRVSDALVEEVRMRDVPFWFAFAAAGALVGSTRTQAVLHDLRYPLAAGAVLAYAAYALIRIAHIGDAADYDSLAFFLYALLFCLAMRGFARNWHAVAMLGSASYFIYLWHIFVVMALRAVPVLHPHPLASFLTEFIAALLVTASLAILIRQAAPQRLAQWLGV
jgi:fucose 4-O-acetylase-like acetyltransferase